MPTKMWRAIRYTIYAIFGIVLGGLSFEAAPLPRVSVLRDQNPATTSLIETRNREARNSSRHARRIQIWMALERISPNLHGAARPRDGTTFAPHHGVDTPTVYRPRRQAS